MWDPKTNPQRESDNEKKEQIAGTTTAASAAANPISSHHSSISGNQPLHHKAQQELNVFDNNSSRNSKKVFECEESSDSGFISGGISSNIDLEELQQENDNKSTAEQFSKLSGLNILGGDKQQLQQQQQQKQQQQEQYNLDSGCIVSEQIAEDDDNDDNNDSENVGYERRDEQKLQATFEQQNQQQVQHEASNTTGAEASVSAANPMLLKQKVDANISEWFVNLSLQSDQQSPSTSTSSQQQQQQQQQQSSTIGINNLNSSKQQQQTQHQRKAQTNNTTTTTSVPTPANLNPSNAWERFYQQNDEGDTPLHLACAFGEEDIVAALIRIVPHPCLFNIQNDEGQTPLHIAARAKQPRILRMLLISGAEPIIRDCRGNTALHLACFADDVQCVRALTVPITLSEINKAHAQYGHRSTDNTMSFVQCAQLPSDLEIRNYSGERCVHIASQIGSLEILRILESYGTDMNAREGRSGYTPLHIAILYNNDEIINFLLNECRNLNLETMTYAGKTAYQIADALEKYQMTHILIERGAEALNPPESDYESSDLESDEEQEPDWFADRGLFTNFPLMVA